MANPRTIFIAGGAGNLGTKLATYLSGQPWCERIILCDVVPPRSLPAKAEALLGDLLDPAGGWRDTARAADGVVHFAAVNPYPDASFADAADSLQMTANLFLTLADTAARVVFASSNHVMGQYKEEAVAPERLTTDLPPLPGTRTTEGGVLKDSPAYASAKLMGERLLLATAGAPGSRVTGVSLRIGWCQPGENHPRTISGDGMPVAMDARPVTGDALRDLTWFRSMWLSNHDFCQLFDAALRADAAGWPSRALVLNAMSNNVGMPWDLGPTRRYLGYAPQDDAWAMLGANVPR